MPDYFYVMSGTIRSQNGNQVFDTSGIVDVQPGVKRSDVFQSVLGKVAEAAGVKPTVGFWSLEENELEPIEEIAVVDQDEAGL